MAQEFSFADCAAPARHAVLGLPLRDYTIGHRLLFLRQRNPLLWSAQADFDLLPFEEQIRWLIEAVTVCNKSYAWRRQLENDETGDLEKKFKADSKKWADLREEASKADPIGYWPAEVAKFRNYIASQTVITQLDHRRDPFPFLPCQSAPEATGRTLGSPYDASLIQFLLTSRLCADEAAAMEYPFGLAEMHYMTHLEHEGALRVMNNDEIRLKDRMEAFDLDLAQKAGFKTAEEHRAWILEESRKPKKTSVEQFVPQAGLASPVPAELKGQS